MRIRLIQDIGYIKMNSTLDLPEDQANELIEKKYAVPIIDSHKIIEEPPKDKMIKRTNKKSNSKLKTARRRKNVLE